MNDVFDATIAEAIERIEDSHTLHHDAATQTAKVLAKNWSAAVGGGMNPFLLLEDVDEVIAILHAFRHDAMLRIAGMGA